MVFIYSVVRFRSDDREDWPLVLKRFSLPHRLSWQNLEIKSEEGKGILVKSTVWTVLASWKIFIQVELKSKNDLLMSDLIGCVWFASWKKTEPSLWSCSLLKVTLALITVNNFFNEEKLLRNRVGRPNK